MNFQIRRRKESYQKKQDKYCLTGGAFTTDGLIQLKRTKSR
ncbi:hypothetical protein M8C21_021187 [Ambrosia artemisiifolia]|uniref:Uncharacterized protein n=1 Tax=Ambrosia artemisiifolia TaxID=4212 RepID=A0AAD5G4V4_AMBAR|nr:hypothetical protein M8C21_021187 [Ambrosia artemisiifolia]